MTHHMPSDSWTETDWRDLWDTIEAFKMRVADRQRKRQEEKEKDGGKREKPRRHHDDG